SPRGAGPRTWASAVTFNRAAGRKPMSVGQPLWGTEMRVVDNDGNRLPPGADHIGELLARGHSVMKGYLRRPAETAEVIRDGWFRTGDLGYVDDDGYYFVVDRIKDLIIRGGYNVYPREIEDVLYGHPDILEAAVIGTPDDRLGEEVVAVVALRDGSDISAEDVIGYCRQHLAAYKYPRVVRFVETLPKGPTNKILKSQLR
ncbi:AMP-binding enzyme, partial [Streptomyces sp. NPDC002920]